MKLGGPQSDRDRKWNKSTGKPPAVESSKEQQYGGDVGRLQEENNSLKNQLKRALKELQIYQNTYPSAYSSHFNTIHDADHGEDDDKLHYWSPSTEKLKPLFEAYDTRINELEDTNKQSNALLDSYKQKMEILVRENEDLRTTLSKEGPFKTSAVGYDPSAPLHVEIITELQEQVDVLRGENNLLMDQRSIMIVELEQHQSELQRKTTELQQQSQQLVTALNEVKSLMIRATQAEKDREAAAQQALSYSQAAGTAEIQQEELIEQLAILKQKCKESDSLVVEFRKQLRSLSTKTEDDSNNSVKRVQDAENRVHELHTILVGKTQELDAANELIRKLRSEYQNTRQDAEGMLQVMGGLERQLNESASREAEVEKKCRVGKEMQEEASILKEQCAARDEQNKREIDRLISERKLMSLRRKDELEKAVEQTRKAMSDQISIYEHNMDSLSEKNAKLIFEAEKATRESRSSRELLERLQKQHDEEYKAMHASLKEITDRLEVVMRSKDQEILKRNEAMEQNKELRLIIEKLRSTIEDLKLQSNQNIRTNESIQSTLKIQLRDLQREVSDKTNSLHRKIKDFDEIKETMSSKISAIERKYQDELALCQRQLAEAHRFAQEMESTNEESDRRTQSTIAQLKEKYASAMTPLEARLRMETDTVKMLHAKIRNAETVIANVLDDKNNALRAVEVAQNELKIQEEDLVMCRSTISDLSNQLTTSHQAREESAIRAARTIEQLSVQGSSSSSPNRRSFEEFKNVEDGTTTGGGGILRLNGSSPNRAGFRRPAGGDNGVNALLLSTDSLGSIAY